MHIPARNADMNFAIPANLAALRGLIALPICQRSAQQAIRRNGCIATAADRIFRNAVRRRKRADFDALWPNCKEREARCVMRTIIIGKGCQIGHQLSERLNRGAFANHPARPGFRSG